MVVNAGKCYSMCFETCKDKEIWRFAFYNIFVENSEQKKLIRDSIRNNVIFTH